MFFSVESVDKTEEVLYRNGKLLNDVPTPCFIPPTLSGNSPHLTPDNLSKLEELRIHNVNIADFIGSVDLVGKTGGKICDLINLPEYKLFISAMDYIHSPIQRNNKIHQSIETVNGRKTITPEQYMDAIATLKPDFFSALADDIDSSYSSKRQKSAVSSSLQWLDKCLEKKPKDSMILGVVVGGENSELRLHSVKETLKREVDGLVIGGFGSCESEEKRNELLKTLVDEIPSKIPRILTKIGLPLDILNAVELGIDAFVSTYPLDVTHFSYALTFWIDGAVSEDLDTKINLRDKKYERDSKSLYPGCSCFTCRNHSRAYINHLLNAHEMLAGVLLYMHNMHHYLRFFSSIRNHIQRGTFKQFKSEFLKNYSV